MYPNPQNRGIMGVRFVRLQCWIGYVLSARICPITVNGVTRTMPETIEDETVFIRSSWDLKWGLLGHYDLSMR